MSLRKLLLERCTKLLDSQFELMLFQLEDTYPKLSGQINVSGSTPIQRAIQLVRFVEQDANGLSRLCEQLDESFTVPWVSFVELENLLQQAVIAEETVRRVFNDYLKTLGEQANWISPDFSTRPLWDCLFDYLLDPSWMKSSGQHHLVNFISHLAPHAGTLSQRRALQDWVRKTDTELGIFTPEISDTTGPQEESQPYLLLAVSPESL